MKRTFALLVFLLCCTFQTKGQQSYTFRHLTTKNGLSYNLVNALHQDREGYIWVGTFNGLNRYDGAQFETFKHDRGNPASLIHNNIMDLCEDRDGNIWIATQGGVSKYLKATNTFVNYVLKSDSAGESQDNMTYNILCDRKGTVYVTSLGGLFEFIPAKDTFKSYRYAARVPQSLSANRISRNAFEEDRTHPWLWVGTEKGLNCFDTDTKTFYNYRHNPKQLEIFNDHPVFPLTIDGYNQLVFADNQAKKLGYYSPQTQAVQYTNEVINDTISHSTTFLSDLFFDDHDNFWVSTWSFTVHVKEAKTGTWQQLRHSETNPSSLNSDFFWDALQARDGTVYIGGL